MTLKLYDLALADPDVRMSPPCWLVKFALLHKGLEFETIPLRFTDKENYPDKDHGKLPILTDNDEIICDSANIVAYLDKKFAGKPFASTPAEHAAADFHQAWLGANLYPGLTAILFVRVHAAAHEDDKAYFRKAREERIGKTLEEYAATPGAKDQIESALHTLSAPLVRHKFLGGDEPNISDYAVMSPFMWQRCVTTETLYETPQAVAAWQERMLDLFDGYGREAKRAA